MNKLFVILYYIVLVFITIQKNIYNSLKYNKYKKCPVRKSDVPLILMFCPEIGPFNLVTLLSSLLL